MTLNLCGRGDGVFTRPRRRDAVDVAVNTSRARAATLTTSNAGREDRQGRSEIYGFERISSAIEGRRSTVRVDWEAAEGFFRGSTL